MLIFQGVDFWSLSGLSGKEWKAKWKSSLKRRLASSNLLKRRWKPWTKRISRTERLHRAWWWNDKALFFGQSSVHLLKDIKYCSCNAAPLHGYMCKIEPYETSGCLFFRSVDEISWRIDGWVVLVLNPDCRVDEQWMPLTGLKTMILANWLFAKVSSLTPCNMLINQSC